MAEIWLANLNTAWAAPVLVFDVLPTQSYLLHLLFGWFLMDKIYS